MLYPVEKLLANRGKVLCVSQTETVRDAQLKMVEHDYSQLPVVDDDGNLVGIISEEIIARTYLGLDDQITLSDFPINDCQERPQRLSPDADLFEALDILQKVYAIVIVEDRKPVGILTAYDTTHFFRNITEGLLIVEDIETTLRQYIEATFGEEHQMQAALMRAFRPDKQDSSKPAYSYDKLNFHQHIQLITTEGNWSRFELFFKPRKLFIHYMDAVNQIRNQLAHYRDELDASQFDLLRRSRDWLENRPKPTRNIRVHDTVVVDEAVNLQVVPPEGMPNRETFGTPAVGHEPDQTKYAPLTQWLRSQSAANAVEVTFDQIDELLQEPLPDSAHQHRSWWGNEYTTNRQSMAWLKAGWKVEDVDLAKGTVVFRQSISVLQQLYFGDLLDRLKHTRPGLTRATKAQPQSWWSFSGGRSGFGFGWAFTTDNSLRVELYIDTGDRATNQRAFDQLYTEKAAIENQMQAQLKWDPLDQRRACRISISRPGTVNDPPDAIETTKTWALATMIRFVDTFQPRIKELKLE